MVNWPYIWAAFDTAIKAGTVPANFKDDVGWARYPEVTPGQPSKPPLGGINLAISAFTKHPDFAVEAVRCLTSTDSEVGVLGEGADREVDPTQRWLAGLAGRHLRVPGPADVVLEVGWHRAGLDRGVERGPDVGPVHHEGTGVLLEAGARLLLFGRVDGRVSGRRGSQLLDDRGRPLPGRRVERDGGIATALVVLQHLAAGGQNQRVHQDGVPLVPVALDLNRLLRLAGRIDHLVPGEVR